MPTTNFNNLMISNNLQMALSKAKAQADTKAERVRESKTQVSYEPNENGFYRYQIMSIINNIVKNGELVESNDTTKTYKFTNSKGRTLNHIINIEAFNNTLELTYYLSSMGIKQICEILKVSDSEIQVIRNVADGKVIETITTDNEGNLSITDTPYIAETRQAFSKL